RSNPVRPPHEADHPEAPRRQWKGAARGREIKGRSISRQPAGSGQFVERSGGPVALELSSPVRPQAAGTAFRSRAAGNVLPEDGGGRRSRGAGWAEGGCRGDDRMRAKPVETYRHGHVRSPRAFDLPRPPDPRGKAPRRRAAHARTRKKKTARGRAPNPWHPQGPAFSGEALLS